MTRRSSHGAARSAHRLRSARLVALVVLVAAPLLACSQPDRAAPPEPDAWVVIGRARVATELTPTRAEMARGLGGRDALAWDHGMLFQYPRPDFLAFWMKDMRFPIDIVWIRHGRVVDISHRVPFDPEGPGPTVRPRELADTVLEVPAGYAQAQGWRKGDAVVIEATAAR